MTVMTQLNEELWKKSHKTKVERTITKTYKNIKQTRSTRTLWRSLIRRFFSLIEIISYRKMNLKVPQWITMARYTSPIGPFDCYFLRNRAEGWCARNRNDLVENSSWWIPGSWKHMTSTTSHDINNRIIWSCWKNEATKMVECFFVSKAMSDVDETGNSYFGSTLEFVWKEGSSGGEDDSKAWSLEVGRCVSFTIGKGQIIATSHDLTPNGGLVRELPWWNIIICPDRFLLGGGFKYLFSSRSLGRWSNLTSNY